MSEDDFFVSGSSSDEADADDEWTDKSARYVGFEFSFFFRFVHVLLLQEFGYIKCLFYSLQGTCFQYFWQGSIRHV